MGLFNKNAAGKRKKQTTGFSELNRRTYEASSYGKNRPSKQSSAYSQQQINQVMSGGKTVAQTQVSNAGAYTNKNNAADYSRQSQGSRYSQQRKKSQKASRRKKIIIIIGCIIAALCLSGVLAYALVNCSLNNGMENIGLTPTSLDKPFYMVLMGVDSSDERKAEEGGTDADFRSDSIILARIAADEKKVTLLSIHRDIEVDMGQYGTQKINAAHSVGGPELVIKCVSNLCGVNINHYAEINFEGFQAAVDNLGGVEVEVPMEIVDELAGYVPQGKVVLNGDQALALARSRHAFDDVGDGDKFRAANQRNLLSAIGKQVLSSDILTIAQVATDMSKYVKTDLNLNDVIGLAQLMKDLNPLTDVYHAMTPTEGVYTDGVWTEKLDKKELEKMMKKMDKGEPPADTQIDPSTGTIMSNGGGEQGNFNGTVSVKNGTDIAGLAATASGKLYILGLTTDVGNADTQDYKTTTIVYDDDEYYEAAQAIKDKLGCGKVIKNTGEFAFTTNILVIIGTDFNSQQ